MAKRLRSRNKKDNDEPPNSRFYGDAYGRVTGIWTKSAGWRPIREVNIHFLNNVLAELESADKKYSPAWIAIKQELIRRDEAGQRSKI